MIASTYCLDVWHGDHTFAIGRCITPHWCCYAVTPVIWHLHLCATQAVIEVHLLQSFASQPQVNTQKKYYTVRADLGFPTCTKLLRNQNLLVHLTYTILHWPCQAICLYSCVKRKLNKDTWISVSYNFAGPSGKQSLFLGILFRFFFRARCTFLHYYVQLYIFHLCQRPSYILCCF